MRETYTQDRLRSLGLLLIVAVIIHAAYTFYVRPVAAAWQGEEKAKQAANPDYKPARSVWVILHDPEQEMAVILGLWALGLSALKVQALSRHRKQLDAGLIRVPAGYRILPGDVREYSHKLDQLPPGERDLIPARTLRRALKRFGETANVQDAATTVHDYCESEAARLDSELAIVRFCVWAIPAIGFVGTVRGIGNALQQAHKAVEGDVSGVVAGLGISFNSTLVALSLCIIVMLVLHQVQLRQERLGLDIEEYVDTHVIRNLQVR